ncbi:hypothetical protein KAJ41_01140 [Candidatus Parcubacteria bacterium]|nr:hypothetical protein [Candidatus Parcubacteria bacterium]
MRGLELITNISGTIGSSLSSIALNAIIPQLRASLGSSDIGFNCNASGPSNFWKILLQFRRNESVSLNKMTWGEKINNQCN